MGQRKRSKSKPIVECPLRAQALEILSTTPALIWCSDTRGFCNYVNPAFLEFTGLEIEDCLGIGWLDSSVHPDDRKNTIETMSDQFCAGKDFTAHFRMKAKDGSYRSVISHAKPLYHEEKLTGYSGCVTDITETKNLETYLMKSALQMENSQKIAKLGSYTVTPGRGLRWSENMYHLLGLDRSSAIGLNQSFMDGLIHPDDRAAAVEFKEKSLTSHKNNFVHEFRIKKGDETYFWVRETYTNLRDQNGNIIETRGVIQDITESVQSKLQLEQMVKELEEKQHFMDSITETSPSLIYSWDLATGKYNYINSACERLLGATPKQIIEGGVAGMAGRIHPDDIGPLLQKQREDAEIMSKLSIEEQNAYVQHTEYRIKGADGKWLWLESHGCILDRTPDGQIKSVVGTARDITARKEMEEAQREILKQREALIHSSKLSSLGQMASGIAHEIFTPITALKMRIQLAQRYMSRHNGEAPKNLNSTLESMLGDVGRTVEIVTGLKLLSRSPENLKIEAFKPSTLIDSTLGICRAKLRSAGINVEVDMESLKDIEAYGIPTLLSQVVVNLLNNAHDAIAAETSNNRWIKVRGVYENERLKIYICNSGTVVPEGIRAKIFEPFFTTKEIGKGTGLGLSISRSIIEQHGGLLALDCSDGHTCFVISLPLGTKDETLPAAA